MPLPRRTQDRKELADFLKVRRERLLPQDVGLPGTGRRRTPGLRREEVAQLAYVGVAWYTWLEQGRAIDVSTHLLERICDALRLNPAERTHLFTLAQNRPPPSEVARSFVLKADHRHVLESIRAPAYIATPCMDVLLWNSCLSAVFGDLGGLAAKERNMLWLMFASDDHRAVIPNWEIAARSMLARFRAEFARQQQDERFLELVAMLRKASRIFSEWWDEHDVTVRQESAKRFHSPLVGELELHQTVLQLEDAPGVRLIIYAPSGPDQSAKIEVLMKHWNARQ